MQDVKKNKEEWREGISSFDSMCRRRHVRWVYAVHGQTSFLDPEMQCSKRCPVGFSPLISPASSLDVLAKPADCMAYTVIPPMPPPRHNLPQPLVLFRAFCSKPLKLNCFSNASMVFSRILISVDLWKVISAKHIIIFKWIFMLSFFCLHVFNYWILLFLPTLKWRRCSAVFQGNFCGLCFLRCQFFLL